MDASALISVQKSESDTFNFESNQTDFLLPDALSWTGNDETLTPQEVFLQVTWELRHLAESIRVNLIRPEPSGGKKFIMLDPKSSSDASYVEKRHRPFGGVT